MFERRFNAVGVESDTQLWATVSYIVQNPVGAGLCGDAGGVAVEQSRGGLDADAAALARRARLLAYFAVDGGNARRRYVELVS